MNDKIIIRVSKDSLNDVNRSNTYQLFVDAGHEVREYEPGNESYEISILNDNEIKVYLTRPQNTLVELNKEMLIYPSWEDWIKEESVLRDNNNNNKKIGDLDHGELFNRSCS